MSEAGQVAGKWQAFFVDIDGNKCSPAGPIGTFAGAVAFCRGYLSRGLSVDVVSGSIPIPFRVDQDQPQKMNGSGCKSGISQWTGVGKGQSIMDVVNQHRSEREQAEKQQAEKQGQADRLNRDYLVGPAISCKEPAPAIPIPPAAAASIVTTLDDANKELSQVSAEAIHDPFSDNL